MLLCQFSVLAGNRFLFYLLCTYVFGVQVLSVAAFKACIGTKFALAVSENIYFQDYLKQLNPGHCPPYQLEHVRILECMIDYAKQELGWIMNK